MNKTPNTQVSCGQGDTNPCADILQNNINMMENTMDLVEDFVNFGTKQVMKMMMLLIMSSMMMGMMQVSLVFGENSALSRLILSGFGPLVENIDSIFNALESLINFKRNILDTFLSENYDREKLLRNNLNKTWNIVIYPARPGVIGFCSNI